MEAAVHMQHEIDGWIQGSLGYVRREIEMRYRPAAIQVSNSSFF